jgi:GAF domain-containing protein
MNDLAFGDNGGEAARHSLNTAVRTLSRIRRYLDGLQRAIEILSQATHLVRDAFGYSLVSLWLNDDGRLTLYSVSGNDMAVSPRSWVVAPQQVVATGRSIVLSDGAAGAPDQSAIAVPLNWAGRLRAVLAIHAPGRHVFLKRDRTILEILATLISAALDRVHYTEGGRSEGRSALAGVHTAKGAIIAIDVEGRVCYLNSAAELLFSGTGVVLGQPIWRDARSKELVTLFAQARDSSSPQHGEIAWAGKGTFSVLVKPVKDGVQAAVLRLI